MEDTLKEAVVNENEVNELLAFLNNDDEIEQEEAPKKKRSRKKKAEGGDKEKAKKEPKPRRNNIEYVQNLESISAVRRFLQIALAKKAKSVDRPDAVARYDQEIEAAKARLAELEERALNSENPVKAFVELDEEPNKIITHFIRQKEEEFKAWEEANSYNVTRTALKNIPNDIPNEFFEELGIDFDQMLHERHEKNDFRLQSICRKFNFKKLVEAGELVNVKGRWISKDEVKEEEKTE